MPRYDFGLDRLGQFRPNSLFLNGVIAEDAVMDQSPLPKVRMPARDRLVLDNRGGGRNVSR